MRVLSTLAAVLILWSMILLALPGCSSRSETPVLGEDSTLVYPSKRPGGVEAKITFCQKVSKKSGKPIDAGRVFTMGKKERVRALIDLKNQFAMGEKELLFHLVWIGPDEKEFYTKQIDYAPSDSLSTLTSSISIPPGKRDPGTYNLRVFLFRELIAEKTFELLPESG